MGVVIGLGVMYFGYGCFDCFVWIVIIGLGDEGNVLIGVLNLDYVECKWIVDICFFSVYCVFYGDWVSFFVNYVWLGLMKVYGWSDEIEVCKYVKVMVDY